MSSDLKYLFVYAKSIDIFFKKYKDSARQNK